MKKYKFNLIIYLAFIVTFCSCYKEEIFIEPDACFTASATTVNAKEAVIFEFCGDGEFIVLYGGDERHIYNDPESKGKIVSNEKPTTYLYSDPGTYTAVCVATSYGDFGEEKKQDIQEIVITVGPEVSD